MTISMTISSVSKVQVLDSVLAELANGDVLVALDRLFAELREIRNASSTDEWLRFAKQTAIEHPLCTALHRDPMLRRSFDKPRGYAGDAMLIDYIYRVQRPEGLDSESMAAYDYLTTARPASLAVQTRRRVVARAIDGLLERPRGSRRVLSVACGHLREGQISRAFRDAALDEVVALDSDADSLAMTRMNYATAPVT